jgi:putative transposase
MTSIESLRETVGVKAACEAIGLPRATFYRKLKPRALQTKTPSAHPSSLSLKERQDVLDVLNQPEWMDQPPLAVYASLLDQGTYLCSVRTMYRILQSAGEVKERRNHRPSTTYKKPELLATAPNQLWSWDITKLKGPQKWSYFYLYVILDVFSRYTVGWMISLKESCHLAQDFISETLQKQTIQPHQLTLHADRGSSMTSKPVAFLLADLGITKSHSRPYTSNDNPFSESQFKTLKYRPEFPERFGSVEDAKAYCRQFFHWYNTQHYHTGIELLTPESVHYGKDRSIIEHRNQVRQAARQKFPERFKGKKEASFQLPTHVWINPPESKKTP